MGLFKKKKSQLELEVEALRNELEALKAATGDLEHLRTNIRNNNALLDGLVKDNRVYKDVINRMTLETAKSGGESSGADTNINAYGAIDYFDFENHFRGAREMIKENQKSYIKYFENCKNVVDIGCGRGEFLELLKENNIKAVGVDTYKEFVDYCKDCGLDVIEGDALEYLMGCESVDGIFAGQLVEHLKVEQIIALCRIACDKLEPGKYLIMETPNPTSLAIYTHAFYLDPSHMKPVHPLFLQYIATKAGFSRADIIYTKESRLEFSIPKLDVEGATNLDEFNKAMERVSELLYSSQDYAVVAVK